MTADVNRGGTADPAVAADGGSVGGTRPPREPIYPVGPQSYVRPPRTRAEKYEHLAFTFCRVGTVGLVAWLVSPAILVLVVSIVAVALYARSITLGVSWSKCFLRRPTLIVGFWGAVAIADAAWLFLLGGRLPA